MQIRLALTQLIKFGRPLAIALAVIGMAFAIASAVALTTQPEGWMKDGFIFGLIALWVFITAGWLNESSQNLSNSTANGTIVVQ